MATATATYAPAAGRQAVTLTSWAGSAAFATTPTAGSQIEGADALTIGVDGVITGPDGTYALHHITTAGVIETDSFAITTPDTTAPVISALTAAGTDPDTIDVAFSTDETRHGVFLCVRQHKRDSRSNQSRAQAARPYQQPASSLSH